MTVSPSPHSLQPDPTMGALPGMAGAAAGARRVEFTELAAGRTNRLPPLRPLVRIADTLLLVLAEVAAAAICGILGFAILPGMLAITGFVAVVASVSLLSRRQRDQASSMRLGFRLQVLLLAIGCGTLAVTLATPLKSGAWQVLLLWPVLWAIIAAGSVTAIASVGTAILPSVFNRRDMVPRVAVVGVNAYGRRFVDRMVTDPTHAADFVGLYDDGFGGEAHGDGTLVLGTIETLVARCRAEHIDAIVLAMPGPELSRIIQSRHALRSVVADIYVATELLDLACHSATFERWGQNRVVKIASRPLSDWQVVQKASLDFLCAATLLLLLSPLLAVIALLVKRDSKGPVLFRQVRRGYNNRTFYVLKFRTMFTEMADAHADQQTVRDDKRITRIGRFLRRTSLDELPQLFNVLRGEMSLVGPRPHALNTKAGPDLFQDVVADYAQRYRVKPGITGWAQVNGWRGETRTRDQIAHRVAHDLYYIDNWSLFLDLKILVLTVLRELNSKVAF